MIQGLSVVMALRRSSGTLPRLLRAWHERSYRRAVSTSAFLCREKLEDLLPMEFFARRHIGPSTSDVQAMLKACGVETMQELISKALPQNIMLGRDLKLDSSMSEYELIQRLKSLGDKNKVFRSYIGMGYHNTITPPAIARNMIENPGWITPYTPYQAELAQGRLESLMNFQTMVCDMTALDVANASLLDEATAAAEAMALCFRRSKNATKNVFCVDKFCHPQSIAVVETRARQLGVEVQVDHYWNFDFSSGDVCGVLLQYPNTEGQINNFSELIASAHSAKVLVAMATDLLALVLLKSPGELGADIALGSCQRMGVPMGFGGPHAGFFAVRRELMKLIPGRIVGQTWDQQGVPTYRLCLQTREQHIRRDKATSNICTSQALLANVSAMYAVYHGPEGLKKIAKRVHQSTLFLAEALEQYGHIVHQGPFFDTIKVTCNAKVTDMRKVLRRAAEKKINLRVYQGEEALGVSLDESVTASDLKDLFWIFQCSDQITDGVARDNVFAANSFIGTELERQTSFLQHPVFNSHHSETALLRYMKQLENSDLSLVHSMIPLGSCTLKLNATAELLALSMPEFNSLHPFVPPEQTIGYQEMLEELERDLCEITGYDKFSFQPNSGAQGEFAGLCTIMAYHKHHNEQHRKLCLIPDSAHGTNPASAQMAGLTVITIPTDSDGGINASLFKKKIEENHKMLAAIMVTYPSTSGVFEDSIQEICEMVHHYGGQVYVDGANMNAQVGLCRPGDYGGDVSHFNLHKTFCIPHGGGGPGMGPIGVKSHLAPFLPTHPVTFPPSNTSFGTVSAAAWGSASILPISWAYIKLMGSRGLKWASEVAILNANYMASRLEGHYPIAFKGSHGFNAHEFILQVKQFKESAKVDATDISKRLQDYGCHAPTNSWPVPNSMMIEPTESEDRDMLDKYCDALIAIREEIREIEEEKYDSQNNVIKNAPHTMAVVTSSNWPYPYSREKAAFPLPWVTPVNKQWPGSGRADEIHGDRNVVATLYDKLVASKRR